MQATAEFIGNVFLMGTTIEKSAAEKIEALCGSTAVRHSQRTLRIPSVRIDASLRESVREIAKEARFDVAFLDNTSISDIRGAFFDMDSTLVANETLDEIAQINGVGKECRDITDRAMRGEVSSYEESLRERVALLKGKSCECLETLTRSFTLNPGVPEFVGHLNSKGVNTYIVSSGFTVFTENVRARLGMKATCANRIEYENGTFTGRVFGPAGDDVILNAAGKFAFVSSTAATLGAPLGECAICCGDGANDVEMVKNARVGVGFRPKPVLRPYCNVVLDFGGFDLVAEILAPAEQS